MAYKAIWLGNIQINARILGLMEEGLEEFGRLRDRWYRPHTPRIDLNNVGFAALASGALVGGGR